MNIESLSEFVELIPTACCLCVGYIIKNVIPIESINRFIPLVVGLLGVLINFWVHNAFTPQVFVSGLFSGLASTGLYEMFNNFIKGGE